MKKLNKQKMQKTSKKIYGFDIETYDNDNKFLCAVVYYDDNNYWKFKDKRELINFFSKRRFEGAYIVATNLAFDFFGVFRNELEEKYFNILFRGSDLIFTKARIKDNKYVDCFNGTREITFIDTLNYARLSVKKMGKILNSEKLGHPKAFGRKPKNKEEWDEMFDYNKQDAKVSKDFLKFLFKGFEKLGANCKSTIASTSMSLFRNVYLKDEYYVKDSDELRDEFKCYYGGRTEAFYRGKIKNAKYYDINSLYPAMMLKELPDPNTKKVYVGSCPELIESYEGYSYVDLDCPNMMYPLLPYRYNNKLCFPVGTFSGYYTHVELRKAKQVGYKIKNVHKSIYYTKTKKIFKNFVLDLYKIRQEYKSKNSPMELVVKLLLNSLYGKFAQKFDDKQNWVHKDNVTLEMINEFPNFEVVENFYRFNKGLGEPSSFCFPIWSAYITAYARLTFYDYASKYNAIYGDTDSIITYDTIEDSKQLGKMKKEMDIVEGYIIKPKFYALYDGENEHIKIKGIRDIKNIKSFMKVVYDQSAEYLKFIKFKESIRRNLKVNSMITVKKNLSLEDTKRDWSGLKFNINTLQKSKPLFLIDGITETDYKEIESKINAENSKIMEEYYKSDLFDSKSVGDDITYDEFMENEIFFDKI